MNSQTPNTDRMVKNMKDWHFSARARNLAMLCRNLQY